MKKMNIKKYIAMALSVSLFVSSTVFEADTWADIRANLIVEARGDTGLGDGVAEDSLVGNDADIDSNEEQDGNANTNADDTETDSEESNPDESNPDETTPDETNPEDGETDAETDSEETNPDEATPEDEETDVETDSEETEPEDGEADTETDSEEVTPEDGEADTETDSEESNPDGTTPEDGETDAETDSEESEEDNSEEDLLEMDLSFMTTFAYTACQYCVDKGIGQTDYHACATLVFPDASGKDEDGNDFNALTGKYEVTLRAIHYYAVDSDGDGNVSMDEAKKAVFTKPVAIEAEFTYPTGTTETKSLTFTPYNFGTDHAEVYNGVICELDGYIEPGTTIKFHGIQTQNLGTMDTLYVEGYPDYHYTAVGGSATEYNASDKPTNYAVTFGQYNPRVVLPYYHPMLYARISATYTSSPTDEKYEYLYDKAYYVENLLSRFNAVSLTDIEGIHIVGPVLSIGTTLRTRESLFSVSDSNWMRRMSITARVRFLW